MKENLLNQRNILGFQCDFISVNKFQELPSHLEFKKIREKTENPLLRKSPAFLGNT